MSQNILKLVLSNHTPINIPYLMKKITTKHSQISFITPPTHLKQYLYCLFLLLCCYPIQAQVTTAANCPISIIANGSEDCNPMSVWLTTTAPAGYSYVWSNSSNEPTIIITSPGTYTVTVSNASEMCVASINIISLSDLEAPTLICPADLDVTIPEGETSTVINLTQATAADNCSTAITLTNDAPPSFPLGTTLVTWTATDAAGNQSSCIQKVNVVNTTCNLTVSVTTTPDSGIGDGTATAIVSNGSGNYAYLWNTSATTATIIGLTAGTYSVTVTDIGTGCTDDALSTVQPIVITILGFEDEDIKVECDGTATGTLSQGRCFVVMQECLSQPNKYRIQQFSTVESIYLTSGKYSVGIINCNPEIVGDVCYSVNSIHLAHQITISNPLKGVFIK